MLPATGTSRYPLPQAQIPNTGSTQTPPQRLTRRCTGKKRYTTLLGMDSTLLGTRSTLLGIRDSMLLGIATRHGVRVHDINGCLLAACVVAAIQAACTHPLEKMEPVKHCYSIMSMENPHP